MFFYIYNQNQSKCHGVFPLHTIVFGGAALIWKVINGLDFSQLLIFGRWWWWAISSITLLLHFYTRRVDRKISQDYGINSTFCFCIILY